jgi:hypothetical protein
LASAALLCLLSHSSHCVSYHDWSERGCSVALHEVASIATGGCAGFESFEVDGVPMIAAANFWDGQSSDMSAKSIVYRLWQPTQEVSRTNVNVPISVH